MTVILSSLVATSQQQTGREAPLEAAQNSVFAVAAAFADVATARDPGRQASRLDGRCYCNPQSDLQRPQGRAPAPLAFHAQHRQHRHQLRRVSRREYPAMSRGPAWAAG